jgi:hypothetical protein
MVIPLHFPKLSRFDRPAEPVTAAVPFPQGALADTSEVSVFDGDRPVPTQSHTTATWPDGSVKWLLVHFLPDLPGNAAADFELHAGVDTVEPPQPVTAGGDGRMGIETGPLALELCSSAERGLIHRAMLDERTVAAVGEITGPVIEVDGIGYSPQIGTDGWRLAEDGPVRVVARCEGTNVADDASTCFDFTAAITAHAGRPWVELEYRLINREDADELTVDHSVLQYHPQADEPPRTAVASSMYRSRITAGEPGETVEEIIDAEQLIYEANEHIPEVMYGAYWADQATARGGLCVSVFQAPQNFPKSFTSGPGGLEIGIIPRQTEGVTFIRGVARAQRMLLHFHGPGAELDDLNVRSLQYQMPDEPSIPADIYHEAAVTEDVFVNERVTEVERYLVTLADGRSRGYGMLNWGDTPEQGYTEQGRGKGEYVWTNNEYDFPHAMMLFYERIGERRLLDYLRRAAEHWMDVDVCHSSDDPMRQGAHITHSARHVTGGVGVSHQWVEGLLDYYHVSGDEFARDTAGAIAENVLMRLEQYFEQDTAGFAARSTGWALRVLVAMYRETRDDRWLAPATQIVDQFEEWMEEYGAWLAPYTSHTIVRVPFMIAVAANSLMRYWRIRPEERVKRMIVAAAEDLLANCRMYDGVFYYKELPSLHRRSANAQCLEILANAWELSGDEGFLRQGMQMFREAIAGIPTGYRGPKFAAGDAVIWPRGPGAKAFAANFFPVLKFYKSAVSAGLLEGNERV